MGLDAVRQATQAVAVDASAAGTLISYLDMQVSARHPHEDGDRGARCVFTCVGNAFADGEPRGRLDVRIGAWIDRALDPHVPQFGQSSG